MSISKILNNTFFRFACVLTIIASVALLFAGCGLGKLADGPDASDDVSGNGSLAVTKGDYLYFVNGYKGVADVADSNHYGNVEQSAIYRVKLDAEGKVTEDTKYDEEGEEIFDKTQSLKNLEILVPKVAGFEYTKLYIFGDFLYYSTPNHLRDKSGEIMSKYINIYRVRLDRAGENDLMYSSDSENSSVKWSMHQIGDVAYMTILDGEKLVVVSQDLLTGGTSLKVVAEEHITTSTLPTYSNSTDTVSDLDKKIYFTEENHDDATTVVLKSFDLATQDIADVFTSKGEQYEIKGSCGENLYYTKTVSNQPGFSAKIYATDFSKNSTEQISSQSYGSSADIRSYALSGQTGEASIFYSDGTNSYYKLAGNTAVKFLTSDIVSKIVKVQGWYVYYLDNSSLYRVKFNQENTSGEAMIPSGVTPKGDIVNNFSVDGDNVYFFVKYTDNYYMHYVDYGTTVSEIDQSAYTHFIGKLLEADYVSEE